MRKERDSGCNFAFSVLSEYCIKMETSKRPRVSKWLRSALMKKNLSQRLG